MGKASKRPEDQLRREARARVEDLPAETAAGRLEGGEGRMPQPEQERRAARTEQMKRQQSSQR